MSEVEFVLELIDALCFVYVAVCAFSIASELIEIRKQLQKL